jgi:lysozyme family protein
VPAERRKKGRPNRRWKDNAKEAMKLRGLQEGDCHD